MPKFRTLILFAIGLFALAACGNDAVGNGAGNDVGNGGEIPQAEILPTSTVLQASSAIELVITEFSSREAAAAYLAAFANYAIFDDPDEQDWDNWVVIATNMPIVGFDLMKLRGDAWWPVYNHHDFSPSNPLLVRWISHGSMAQSGMTFLDENGDWLQFSFNTNQADEGPHMIISQR
ncbi:MAG: hypothetical protein LBE35_04690 [Clostridiales bacterium]|jgi:hypothetical protein|nr:hypothetical protein [Clostridiales bacterium]